LIATGLDAEVEQSDTASDSAPEQLGAYTIEHHADGSAWELGRGAMGVTYRAIDKALDRPVALKIINTDAPARSAEARERFMREARAAAALRHPNVATVYQFGVLEGGIAAQGVPERIEITVNPFVQAWTDTYSLVPQQGTSQKLDTLGDKIMTPVVYQNRNGTASLWAAQTTMLNFPNGPTAVSWYQFDVTGGNFPAAPVQQQ